MTQREAEQQLDLQEVPKDRDFRFMPGDLILTNTLELVFVRELSESGDGSFSVSRRFFGNPHAGKSAWWDNDEVIRWKPSALRQLLDAKP